MDRSRRHRSARPRRISFAKALALLIGLSVAADHAFADTVPQMAAPTLTGGERQVSLTWSHPQGVTGLQAYRIRYREKGQGTWTFADAKADDGEQNFEGHVTSATIPAHETFAMKDGTTYETQIRAGKWNAGYDGWGAWSPIAEATTLTFPTLTASEVTETTATLTIANHTGNWYHKDASPSAGTCSGPISQTTADLSGLTGGTDYTWKAYSDSSCSTEIASETFSTVGLTASAVLQTTATLTIANHTAAWWYQGEQAGANCTSVQAGTASVSLGSLTASTDYTYAAYDAGDCGASDEIADVDFTTLAPVTFSADRITESGARLTLANHPSAWHYQRTSPSAGTCTEVASGTTETLADLTAGQSYTYQAFSDSACTTANKIGEETFTTIDFAFVSKTNTTATLRLNHYPQGQQWWHAETARSAVPCTATTAQQITVTGLTKNTAYRVEAYRAAGCVGAHQIGLVDLKTFPPYAIFADSVTQTTATLRLANLPSIPWWYQQVTPAGSCSSQIAAETTTAPLSDLAPSTSYTYRAHRDACTQNARIDDIVFYTLPAAPGKPTATAASATSITVSWTPDSTGGSRIDKWQYVKKAGSGDWETTWTDMSGSTATTTSHTVSGLNPSTAYKFKVRANNATTDSSIDGGGAGAASAESDSVTTPAHSLTAGSVTHDSATLTISNHTGNWYYKYTAPIGGDCSDNAVATASVDLANLAGNTSYTFKAYSDSACSSANLLATATAFLTKPAKPAKPNATPGAGSGKLTLASSVAGGSRALTKWQYTKDDGTNWIDISETKTTLSEVVSGLTDGTDYSFKVRAVNDTGTGPDSDASTAAAPLDETLTASKVEATTATLTVGNYSGNWYYKHTSPNGGSCSTEAVTGTTEDLSDLTPGTSYTFKAYSNSDCSTELAAASAFLTKPAKTTGVTVTALSGKLGVSWTAVTSATSYKVQWKSGSQEYDDSAREASVTSAKHTIPSLTNDTEYTLRVAAVNATGDGAWADEAKGTPGAVTLTATEITRTSATLTLGNYTGAWSYKSTAASSACNAVADGITEASLTDLTAGTDYSYVAFSSSTCGPTTTEIARETFTTPAAATLTASAAEASTATLTIGNHTGNWYYKRTKPTAGSCSGAVSETSADLTGLDSGASHTYKAYSDSNCSKELASETFLTKPGKATGVSLEPASREVKASWTATTGAASYKVQWKSGNENYDTSRQATPNGASHTITGLTNDTEYTVRVAAVNATGDGAWSDDASATPRAVTLTATNIAPTTATLEIGGHTQGWAFSRIGSAACTAVPANTASKKLTGLTARTEYTYHAFAGASCVTSLKIAEHTFTTLDPVTLTASNIGATTATLTITKFAADWHYEHTTPANGTCSVAVSGDSATATGLAENTAYTFAAYSDSTCSTLLATAASFPTLPPKPGKPTATAVTGGMTIAATVTGTAALVRWEYKQKEGSSGFDASWTAIGSTGAALSHTIAGLAAGTAYQFKVRAVNASGPGAESDPSDATLPAAQADATLTVTGIAETGATLTLGNHSGPWHFRHGPPNGGECSGAVIGTSAAVPGLAANTYYTFTAYSDGNCATALATAARFATLPPQPAKPAAAPGAGSGKLTLSSSVAGPVPLVGWEYRKREGGAWDGAWTRVPGASTSLRHTVAGLTNGARYQFRVRAVNASGAGAASGASDAAAPLAEVLSVRMAASGATLVIENYVGVWHYRQTAPSGGPCLVAENATTASLGRLSDGMTYTYAAYSDRGCTAALASVTFTTAGLNLSQTAISLSEGAAATYAVALAARPSGDVTVTIEWTGHSEVTVNAAPLGIGGQTALTFTPANFATAQAVSVAAPEDADGEDDAGELVHTASGGGYGGVAGTVALAIADNDRKALLLSTASVALDEGASATYTVALATEPTAPVTVAISVAGDADLTVDADPNIAGAKRR